MQKILAPHGRTVDGTGEREAHDAQPAEQLALSACYGAAALDGERAGQPLLRIAVPSLARNAEPVAEVMGFKVNVKRSGSRRANRAPRAAVQVRVPPADRWWRHDSAVQGDFIGNAAAGAMMPLTTTAFAGSVSRSTAAHVDERGQVVSPPTRRPGRRTGTGAHAGYSLHASTVVAAGDREGLERLLRYCARPALSLERLRETQDGRYAYELKYPSLGRTHLVLTPTELLARLSLLVAPPRVPLVRYGGLFAPAHGLRKAIVSRAPGPPGEEGCRRAREGGEAKEAKAGKEATAATSERTPSPSPTRADAGLARALLAGEAEAALTAPAVGSKRGELLGAATPKPWLDWATLLRRTFDLDVLACPCGGRLQFIALVTERDAIVPLLESPGLPTTPPVRARARSPTLFEMDPMPVYA